MNKIRAVIIQARMSSRRLPGKTLMYIGQYPLLYYVIKRLELTGLPVIVATSSDPSDDELTSYLESENFKFFRGDLTNVLKRYIATANEFGVEEIIRITADNPLVDIEALIKALPLFERFSYVDGIGKESLIKGTGFELVKLSDLKSITSMKSEHLEHVTMALRERIEHDHRYINLPVPSNQKPEKEIFITCDYPEDLELLRIIFKEFNYSIEITIPQILDLYKAKPHIFSINKHLHINIST